MAFLVIFGLGLVLTVITFVIGELFDLGDVTADSGGEVGTEGATASPFSSRILFVFATAFGGFGFIGSTSGWPLWASVGLAVVGGLLVAGGTFFLIVLPMARQQGWVRVSESEFVGAEGRITAEIPEGGTGRVTLVAASSGARVAQAARSADGSRIPLGTVVRIVHTGQGMAVVAPLERESAEAAATQEEQPS
ncbi:MAG: YqiJ family protein [Dehalococcoidia bacterium]|nr:YqiJ family protein [Dehalococcoidia bacterium]